MTRTHGKHKDLSSAITNELFLEFIFGDDWRRALIAVFAQLLTHPLVWFVFPRLVGLTGRSSLALSELWAWLAEAAFYAVVLPGLSSARALGVSALANAASILVGLAIF